MALKLIRILSKGILRFASFDRQEGIEPEPCVQLDYIADEDSEASAFYWVDL